MKFLSVFLLLIFFQSQCLSTLTERPKDLGAPTRLPPLRAEASECYFLDEFMPTPDSLVTGKQNGVHLRYYTYNRAILRLWGERPVTLSFYSHDNHCWSLFERSLL